MSLSVDVIVNQYCHYYQNMTYEHQEIYNTLLNGYLELKKKIWIKCNDISEVWEIHQKLTYDIPDVFYIKSLKALTAGLIGMVAVYVEYRFDSSEINAIREAMFNQAYILKKRTQMLSEIETVKVIHDYLVRNVKYEQVDAPYSHEAPGSIIYGIGVCEGISKAFKYFADNLGLQSVLVTGNAKNHGYNQNGGHAWNIVYIGEQPYHIDVTFDYSLSDKCAIRYDYFLISDEEISSDHFFEKDIECSRGFNYYSHKGCYATTKTELKNIINTNLWSAGHVVFQLPYYLKEEENLAEYIINIVNEVMPVRLAIRNKVLLRYNIERLVFCLELTRST